MSRGPDREEWERPGESSDARRAAAAQGRAGGSSSANQRREISPAEIVNFDMAALRTRIDDAVAGQPTLSQFLDRLEASGIHVLPSIQSSGRLNGFTYEMGGVRLKASALGRAYTPKGLQEKKGVRYEPDRDDPRLHQALEAWRPQAPSPSERQTEGPRTHDHRENLRGARDRHDLTDAHRELMIDVGRFRTVALPDLARSHYHGNYGALERDLSQLITRNLMERHAVALDHRRSVLHVVALTRKGKALLQQQRETPGAGPRQALYAGIVKPREVAHDAMIYRMYQAEAAHIERSGGKVRRVLLDYELKKRVYSPLAKDKDLPALEHARRQQQVAEENGLKVVDGHIVLPDLRIEYENAQGELAKVDLELATRNYRGSHLKPKVQAGFKLYVEYGHAGAPVFDDHDLVGEILWL
jgi:hypothetical protein